jgi:hypothetical protein
MKLCITMFAFTVHISCKCSIWLPRVHVVVEVSPIREEKAMYTVIWNDEKRQKCVFQQGKHLKYDFEYTADLDVHLRRNSAIKATCFVAHSALWPFYFRTCQVASPFTCADKARFTTVTWSTATLLNEWTKEQLRSLIDPARGNLQSAYDSLRLRCNGTGTCAEMVRYA